MPIVVRTATQAAGEQHDLDDALDLVAGAELRPTGRAGRRRCRAIRKSSRRRGSAYWSRTAATHRHRRRFATPALASPEKWPSATAMMSRKSGAAPELVVEHGGIERAERLRLHDAGRPAARRSAKISSIGTSALMRRRRRDRLGANAAVSAAAQPRRARPAEQIAGDDQNGEASEIDEAHASLPAQNG